MTIRSLVIGAAVALTSLSAIAGPQCTTEAKDKWMSETAMQKRIADAGYSIEKFKVTSGNCYEIYGRDKAGERVEIYFSPIDGSVVKQKLG